MNYSQMDDAALLGLARTGQREALGLLLFRTQRHLRSVLAPHVGQRLQLVVSPDDVVQETYRQVFDSIEQFEGHDISSFSAWVRQIGMNQIRQLGRAESAAKRGGNRLRVDDAGSFASSAGGLLNELSTGDSTVSQFVARAEAVEALQVALSSLPADQQQAIRLRYFEQLAVKKVAEAMDRSEASIRGLLDRAKNALRTAMHYSALWLSHR